MLQNDEAAPLFVYMMSQVQICACTRICTWRMYIIELLSEMVYKVYKSSRRQSARGVNYLKKEYKRRKNYKVIVKMHKTARSILRTIYKLPGIYRKALATGS